MSAKFFVYLFTTPLVIFAMDSLNINQIFKKNKAVQARLLYVLLGCSLIYLISNFVYDFFLASKFI